jgi:anti-sigma regulatory factor (Ser/Thr protein kinase)
VHGARLSTPDTGLDISTWAHDALARMTDVAHVHRAGLALTEGGGRRLRFTASDRGAGDWCHVDAYDDVPLNTAVRTGEAVLGSLDDLADRYPELAARQRGTPTVAIAAVPLVAAGQVLGGAVLFWDRPQAFDERQRAALRELGAELGAHLRRVQRTTERTHASLADAPVPSGAKAAHHDVPPDPAAVSGARRFLRRTLQGWGVDDDTSDTAVLCLSELVTNAVIHTHAGCSVSVLLDDGVLATVVRDSGVADDTADEARDEPLRVHGRGLQLVDALVARWGSELDASGTTVWFVLELD